METDRELTQAEIDANVALTLAEARRAEAEAKAAEANATKSDLEARVAAIVLDETERQHRARLAADLHHHVYRFGGEVSGKAVTSCMMHLTEWHRLDPECDIEVVFSSPGGSIVDGMALFDFLQQLRRDGHRITTGSIGYAASMAGVLLQAGDHRWIGEQSWLMIHRAAFGAVGQTHEIEDRVKWVQRIERRIIQIFTTRSHLTERRIRNNWDRKDWWIEAEEALELGLVDEVRGKLPEREA